MLVYKKLTIVRKKEQRNLLISENVSDSGEQDKINIVPRRPF